MDRDSVSGGGQVNEEEVHRNRLERVRLVRECADRTTDVMRNAMDVAENVGHTREEAILALCDEFQARADMRFEDEDLDGIRADYTNYCGVLCALVDAQDYILALQGALALRDSLIEVLDTDVILLKEREDGEDHDGETFRA